MSCGMKPNNSSVSRAPRPGQKIYPFLLLALLVLPALACGLSGPRTQLNNGVRLAVFEYMRSTHGPAQDLVLHFNRGEPRVNFEGQNQNGGRTVWLYSLGAREYFATRPPQATYLYIREIELNDDGTKATTQVYYGDGQAYEGRQLTLARDQNNLWQVTEEQVINQE